MQMHVQSATLRLMLQPEQSKTTGLRVIGCCFRSSCDFGHFNTFIFQAASECRILHAKVKKFLELYSPKLVVGGVTHILHFPSEQLRRARGHNMRPSALRSPKIS
jgi:hypothetical protein